MIRPEWIAADWGTTNLRIWAMDGDRILESRSSSDGMGVLKPDQYPAVLARVIDGWGKAPVIACGMVGSRQGWREAPYTATPTLVSPHLVAFPGQDVWIVSGVKQMDPPDVMRGEETQIAGLLKRMPTFSGTVCLPGTHTKWVRVEDGEIISFQSFMTGELYSLLSNQSVLRHSVGDGNDPAEFMRAVKEALADPTASFGRLFQLRAGGLVGDLTREKAGDRLSGLLIGWELASAKRYWDEHEVMVIGAPRLFALYHEALQGIGAASSVMSGEDATLAGLCAAWSNLKDTL